MEPPKQDIVVTTVRLPREIYVYLSERAKKYYSSHSAEITRLLRGEIDREKADGR